MQRLVANNFKFTESQRTRDNREAVKRDSNNVFDFLESEGYIRLKADCTISSKDLYEIYRMWCEENNLTPLKRRSFSDSVIASQTGRDHIPPRVFKEMTRLTKQKAKLEELLSGVNAFNAKGKAAEIGAFLDKYIPAVEQMHTTLKKYNTAFTVTTAENKKLKKKTEQLEQSLDKATQGSTLKKLADAKLHRDYEDAVAVLDRIPKEVLAAYTHRTEKERETAYGR